MLPGLTWNTTYLAPSIWVSPLPPETEVLPELPPLDGPATDVGFREADLLSGGSGTPGARKPQAAHGTRDFVRGSLASVPFKPGECCDSLDLPELEPTCRLQCVVKWRQVVMPGVILMRRLRFAFGAARAGQWHASNNRRTQMSTVVQAARLWRP